MVPNWCKRHLNIILTVFHLIVGTAVNLMLARMTFGDPVYFAIGVGSVVSVLVATAWFLRQKSRSLWYLIFAVLSWVGFIVLLCLENRSTKPLVESSQQ